MNISRIVSFFSSRHVFTFFSFFYAIVYASRSSNFESKEKKKSRSVVHDR